MIASAVLTFEQLPGVMQTILHIMLMVMAIASTLLIILRNYYDPKKNFIITDLVILIFIAAQLVGAETATMRDEDQLIVTFMRRYFILLLPVNSLICVYMVVSYKRIRYKRRTAYSSRSVKEALTALPTGICYSGKEGNVLLANRAINRFIWEMLGSELMNIDDAWDRLREIEDEQKSDYLRANPDSIVLTMSDESIKYLVRSPIEVDGMMFTETVVTDITLLHKLTEEVRQNTIRLKSLYRELKELSDNLVMINHEEEVMRHKIMIHNNVGNMILFTRKLLSDPDAGNDALKDTARQWKVLCDNVIGIKTDSEKGEEIALKELLDTAKEIGFNVGIHGSLSEFSKQGFLVRQILREAMMNSIRHGGADTMDVYPSEAEQSLILTITNNGSVPEHITPSGGLKSLTEAVARSGGSIEIKTDDIFTLIVMIPKDEEGNMA
ncbi:MAG: hypothetical protein IKN24_06320 [Lachnospiraceae bacterium]|nr:hypothetical protein [Lachnospiraceae bacterium]